MYTPGSVRVQITHITISCILQGEQTAYLIDHSDPRRLLEDTDTIQGGVTLRTELLRGLRFMEKIGANSRLGMTSFWLAFLRESASSNVSCEQRVWECSYFPIVSTLREFLREVRKVHGEITALLSWTCLVQPLILRMRKQGPLHPGEMTPPHPPGGQ